MPQARTKSRYGLTSNMPRALKIGLKRDTAVKTQKGNTAKQTTNACSPLTKRLLAKGLIHFANHSQYFSKTIAKPASSRGKTVISSVVRRVGFGCSRNLLAMKTKNTIAGVANPEASSHAFDETPRVLLNKTSPEFLT